MFAGFFTGIPNIHSASADSGAPVDHAWAGSSGLNEVEGHGAAGYPDMKQEIVTS
jgi:hypothetical protein